MEHAHADKRSHKGRSNTVYWRIDSASEYLIYAILIFTPWAFGTTETWAIQTVNTLNYILAGFLVAKWITRLVTGFHPARWDGPGGIRGIDSKVILIPLATLTVVMLAYTAIAAINARAEFIPSEQRFEYFEYKKWLPTSYDRSATWDTFQRYLAIACFFWALRDWVATKTRREARPDTDLEGEAAIGPEVDETAGGYYSYDPTRFPIRLKRLLWVICANGALLAVQGTLQRLSGSDELLWSVRPMYNQYSYQQFGPFNYRSNGAQYLNMIWPIALAFWWALNQQRRKKFGEGAEFLLMVFAGLMAAGPVISSSRGGVAIEAAQMLGVLVIFAYSFRRGGWWKTALVAAIFAVIVGSAAALSWQGLQFRLQENTLNTLSGRTEIYDNAKRIVEDYPVFGTGPGTFSAVYQLYRSDPEQQWYVHAHDDYLHTVVTFGRVGFTLIMFMLVSVFAYWFLARGIPTSELFIGFVWVAAAGCLLHARFDFPLQIYSLQLLFMTLCAILTALARRS
ncbi:MAG TPA: O-antigen ligase family protein [Verrucomicrobiae bacterium]|nr:O-antigen ligase family protein [Verrucomicrobiae bacterium]